MRRRRTKKSVFNEVLRLRLKLFSGDPGQEEFTSSGHSFTSQAVIICHFNFNGHIKVQKRVKDKRSPPLDGDIFHATSVKVFLVRIHLNLFSLDSPFP